MKVGAQYSTPDAPSRRQDSAPERPFLFQIERNGKIIASVSHDEKIQENDRCSSPLPETYWSFRKRRDLSILKDERSIQAYDSDTIGTFEAVVSLNSP